MCVIYSLQAVQYLQIGCISVSLKLPGHRMTSLQSHFLFPYTVYRQYQSIAITELIIGHILICFSFFFPPHYRDDYSQVMFGNFKEML